MNGYMGKILEVDLNTGRLADRSTIKKPHASSLEVRGLGLNIIYDELKPDVDPLGPDNIIVFATGPATGTRFPTGGRYYMMAMESPLTGSVGSSNSGGRWGPPPKAAGYDAVVVRGAGRAGVPPDNRWRGRTGGRPWIMGEDHVSGD